MRAKLRVIVGHTRSRRNVERLKRLGWGRCVIGDRANPFPGEPWMLDNGAWARFNQARKAAGVSEDRFLADGCPGLEHDWTKFEAQLRAASVLAHRGQAPFLVVAPDRIRAGEDSFLETWVWLDRYHHDGLMAELDPVAMEYGHRFGGTCALLPLYLAVQDGMTTGLVEGAEDPEDGVPLLRHFAGIFLGGSGRYKYEAGPEWRALSRAWGMKLHYGRCGTPGKVEHARRLEVDSLDSAFPLWTEERTRLFIDHIENGPAQADLFQ